MQSQAFSIIYQGESFVVDYSKLCESSNKFREMIKSYHDNQVDLQKLQLRILYDKFSPRNVSNFLKIIQNKKNDVHSNEIAEVCELAKLFQVEKLYNKSLIFVRKQFDPNFTVSNDFIETNGQKYLEIEYVNDTSLQNSHSTSEINLTSVNSSINSPSSIYISNSQESLRRAKHKLHCICYKIQIFNPLTKCCRYFFSQEGRILYTAKKKLNTIYIGQGNDIHIHENGNEACARIMQCDGYNIAYANNQEFKITYIPFGQKKQYSLETSFAHQGRIASWRPREIDVFINGEYNHVPIPSKRNALLQNQNGSPTFAVRKMDTDVFEVECLSTVNSLIAFTIGLSQIVGPYV